MDNIMQWLSMLTFWHWMVLGAALIIVELLAPGIWFLWLGIGAIATGLVVLFLADLSWQVQAVIFSGFSVVSVIVGRIIMRRTKQSEDHPMLNKRVAKYVGNEYVLEHDTRHGVGEVRIGDSIWRVQLSDTSVQLSAGDTITVTGVDGATLKVDPTQE
jgi:membrane protein implicated in regulation of membrane protease activity